MKYYAEEDFDSEAELAMFYREYGDKVRSERRAFWRGFWRGLFFFRIK